MMTYDKEVMDVDLSSKVAHLCVQHYSDILPKKGKPRSHSGEWTLLAAVIQTDEQTNERKVVAIATGSKCIGASKMCKEGSIINDSHAEVLARRAFIRYLYEQVCRAFSGQQAESIFAEPDPRTCRCSLKDGISFCFYTSHTPCGDASIFPKAVPTSSSANASGGSPLAEALPAETIRTKSDQSQRKDGVNKNSADVDPLNRSPESHRAVGPTKRPRPSNGDHNLCKKLKVRCPVPTDESASTICRNPCPRNTVNAPGSCAAAQEPTCAEASAAASGPPARQTATAPAPAPTPGDIYRIGAKCVSEGPQDPCQSGANYHRVGLLRLKPGRGDPTLSMSCSDKMAKWNVVGWQGALLSHFVAGPIHVKAVIVGKCPYNQEAVTRALHGRIRPVSALPDPFLINFPEISSFSQPFPDSKEEVQSRLSSRDCKLSPSSGAIIWSDVQHRALEVSVNGKKQGFTNKCLHNPKARCSVSKAELFQSFKNLVKSVPAGKLPSTLRTPDLQSYRDFKMAATAYQQALDRFYTVFNTWVKKSEDYEMFT